MLFHTYTAIHSDGLGIWANNAVKQKLFNVLLTIVKLVCFN